MRRHLILTAATGILIAATSVPAVAVTRSAALPYIRGGWAATIMDAGPAAISPNRPFTLTFWVLQHGVHPVYPGYGGEKNPTTGLRFVDESGARRDFIAKPLPEKAHFSVDVTVPHPGTWTIWGIQDPFVLDRTATLTLPGTVTPIDRPAPPASSLPALRKEWGAVHPPYFVASPPTDGDGVSTSPYLPEPSASFTTPAAAVPPRHQAASPWRWALPGAALVLALAALGHFRRRSPDDQQLIG